MPKGGGSESSSSSSTSSNSEDNKVSATDNAIALGKDSSFNYSDEFSDNVKDAYLQTLELARQAGEVAIGFAQKAIESNEKATATAAQRATTAEENAALKDQVLFNKVIPYIGVALIAMVITGGGKKK